VTASPDGCATSTRPIDPLRVAGEHALTDARQLFDLDVFDPPIGSTHPRAAHCLQVIGGIMRINGWEPKGGYKGNGPPQWCGMFAGACWRAAGLDPKWLRSWFASTLRLHAWATYRANPVTLEKNPRPVGDDLRLCAELAPGRPITVEPRAGDILIVGDGTPRDGDHITIVESYDPAHLVFTTISGNGGGAGPHGDVREGISRRYFAIGSGRYRAMLLIRPALGDLVLP
jgi:hypothetical protein